MDGNWVIKALWVGPRLTLLERICLKSFIAHGHEVHLFTYQDMEGVPDGVIVRDGNEILSEDNIFVYRKSKSVSAFSNWFRYEMLYKEGGVWIDTDVVCMRPFDFEVPLFFGRESWQHFNCAVIGALPGQEVFQFLSRQCESPHVALEYDDAKTRKKKFVRRYLRGNKRDLVKWGELGPKGFTAAIRHFDLQRYAMDYQRFYAVPHERWDQLFYPADESLPEYLKGAYAVHLWNEMLKKDPGISKEGPFAKGSLMSQWAEQYCE